MMPSQLLQRSKIGLLLSVCLLLTACATGGKSALNGTQSTDTPATPNNITTESSTPDQLLQISLAKAPTPPPPPPAAPNSLKATANIALEPPTDIWQRIRQGFAMPDLDGSLVRDREEWYAARPDYMIRMTERSRKYLFHIVEELERRNMPTELALLPFIESAFNPEAVSTAKAAGMWQFMPATGKYFELKQNIFRDDRRGVIESTRAALDYLQKLYGMFGDWHLALAAYNWGEGSISRALAKNKAAGLGLTYGELSMPNETRYYVPKLQAIKNIIAQPANFNARLPLIQNHPYFKSISITRDIDVNLAARFAGITLEDFKALNPSMSRPVILAAGTPEILLPWDNADNFQRSLEAHANKPLASWTAWSVPQTMKAAQAAQNVGMTEALLRSVNQIPVGMLVKQGSTLVVARKGVLDADVTEHLADNAQLSFSPEVLLRRIMVTVHRGDTLATLASRHGVSASNIASWNKLKVTAALKPGQTLAVLVPTTASAKGSRSAGKKPPTSSGKRSQAKRGDVKNKPGYKVSQRP